MALRGVSELVPDWRDPDRSGWFNSEYGINSIYSKGNNNHALIIFVLNVAQTDASKVN